ncbi:hypothetical protein DYB25_004713 [Aphanomyces astaci]|uniref:PH domain-containing protein n=1 Tax=Aphanomyces astaci TaxID=112090 RepID=A0A397B0F7_APHAT|nr:hypothetical protein DYB25_004713 [Aphanomyces astaci]RHY65462.1 hypothetical protein DYB34_000306 [Aphanomyces astaci]
MEQDAPAAVCAQQSVPLSSSSWSEFIMISTIAISSVLMLVRALFGGDAYRRALKNKSSNRLLGGRKKFQSLHQQTMQNVDESVLADVQTLGDSVLDGYCTMKKGSSSTTWKKRWVVVDAYARVKYYPNAEGSRRNTAPKGTFTVLSVDVAPSTSNNSNQPTLEVRNTLGGTYFFHFDDDVKMQKWLVVLKSRAMQSAIDGPSALSSFSSSIVVVVPRLILLGRIDPMHSRDRSAPHMKHDLIVLVETFNVLAHKDTSMRSFFAVVKFKAELHDHSVIPVKQTNQRSCSHDEKESILGTLQMTLDYTATSQVDATAALTPFLTSAPSDLELLGEFELDMPLLDLLDTYYADPPDGAEASANPVWAQYIKERGDTEVINTSSSCISEIIFAYFRWGIDRTS